MDAKTICFINLKGGVAKTTTTVGTAFALAGQYKKKVLVIDLDPQTNATVMLIGDKGWKKLLDQKNSTIYEMFYDVLYDENHFDIKKAIQHDVGNIKNMTGIDLLASHLKMVELQDFLADIRGKRDFSLNPHDILINNLEPLMKNYDYILVDCPPNLGILTLNGIKMADGFIVPTVPDILSTYGIPQILSRIEKFSRNCHKAIPCIGIVFTKVRQNSSLHIETMRDMRIANDTHIFETVFPENVKIAEAAAYEDEPMTILQKWGYQGQYDKFVQFAGEIIAKMGEKKDE